MGRLLPESRVEKNWGGGWRGGAGAASCIPFLSTWKVTSGLCHSPTFWASLSPCDRSLQRFPLMEDFPIHYVVQTSPSCSVSGTEILILDEEKRRPRDLGNLPRVGQSHQDFSISSIPLHSRLHSQPRTHTLSPV